MTSLRRSPLDFSQTLLVCLLGALFATTDAAAQTKTEGRFRFDPERTFGHDGAHRRTRDTRTGLDASHRHGHPRPGPAALASLKSISPRLWG